jgi:hypothetical protein
MIPTGALAGDQEVAMKKGTAVSQAAAAMCMVKNGEISEEDSNKFLSLAMQELGIFSVMPWLKTKQGIEAVQVASTYLSSDCQNFEDPEGFAKAVMPYLH